MDECSRSGGSRAPSTPLSASDREITPSPHSGEGWGEEGALLSSLGMTPEDTLELPSNDRSRLLNFLLRWECFDVLHTCLDVLIPY